MRLSSETVGLLPAAVARPRYHREAQRSGIVHLGVGAFHRGHQAVYTDDALNDGDPDWRITGVSLRSSDMRDMLGPQDGLYTVIERTEDGQKIRLVGAIDKVLVAAEDPQAVITALADPAVHVVTLTVTEKGYYRDPASGRLLLDDPAIAAELAGGPPTTLFGFLDHAIARRLHDGAGPLTLVSCDNLPGNGRLLRRLLDEYLAHGVQNVQVWAKRNIACVDTMVDRIVPAVSDQERTATQRLLDVDDHALVVTEPFRQWVIEDAFVGPRPRWEAGGAQFVQDVAPFELAKLRLLNGSHSTLAYIGLQLGFVHVHEAISDPDIRTFVVRQMVGEVAPTLPHTEGQSSDRYIEAILERFANAQLPHRLAQIATDGSQKIPQRLIATIVERMRSGQESPCHILSLAAWLAFTGRLSSQSMGEASDPMAARFIALWQSVPPNIAASATTVVDQVVADFCIFPETFENDTKLMHSLRTALTAWLTLGGRACLAAANDLASWGTKE